MEAAGIAAVIRSEYTSYDQKTEERNFGINSLQRVEVRFIKQADLPVPAQYEQIESQPETLNTPIENQIISVE